MRLNNPTIVATPPRSAIKEQFPLAELQAAFLQALDHGDEGIIELVDICLVQAFLHRASDIHIEPREDGVSIRYRIDGILHQIALLPREHHAKITGRIKVLSRILTYQKDVPQDGRIDPENTPCGRPIRVSTLPTVSGDKIVLRILDNETAVLELDALGFSPAMTAAIRTLANKPQGTLLLTGPASSGKTTTIYAILKEILRERNHTAHIVTIEDPVEYRLGCIAQTQVNNATGFTFETALRAVLRQDPEIIMLGEIRDPETARIAIQAGLTGHLVISTIHSGTAAGVFTRLLDMGIEPFLIASSITGVLAQRLLRRNCTECLTPYLPDPILARQYGFDETPEVRKTLRRGLGCDVCQHIGYRGRMAIGELLCVDEALSELLMARPRTHVIHDAVLQAGMKPMALDALHRVREGLTTFEEIQRILPPSEKNTYEKA